MEAFDDWTSPAAWAFILTVPTPAELQNAGARKWERFLHAHKLWRPATVDHRLEIFGRATELTAAPATVAAKSLLAASLAHLLQGLDRQLEKYRDRINETFAQHPDGALFGSLPGTGEKLAPRLLAELGDDRRVFQKAESLQCYAGTAPLTVQSGRRSRQKMRHACNDTLRGTIHLWANLSRARCAWAQTYYEAHRAKGQSHAVALRCLGQRWLKILWKMWQTRTTYDEGLHTKNQTTHGSWVLTLKADTT